MNSRFFETFHECEVAIGATRETVPILGFAVRTEHRGLARKASLRGHTRFELDSNGSGVQGARESVTRIETQLKSILQSRNAETKNYVLLSESR
jgi:hypothetical protein